MDKASPPKPSPQRPPPPKIGSFKGSSSKEHDPSPTNPIPAIETVSYKKPKPPIRTRKKKFATEDVKQVSRQSEFVELSTSDIIVDEDQSMIRSSSPVNPPEQRLGDLEEKEEEETSECEVREVDLERDDWEVIPDSAAGEESRQVVMDEPCLQPNG